MREHTISIERPSNEPILGYMPGSAERADIEQALAGLVNDPPEYGSVICGEEVLTGRVKDVKCPHDHSLSLGCYHQASAEETNRAIDAALAAQAMWSATPWERRVAIFQKAAHLLATKYRAVVNAATMLNQSKVVLQAEIDAACELIDFWRFNAYFAAQIYQEQPSCSPGVRNWLEYRPLEGFVFAVSPFNFTSIQGNLPTAAALMGCTAVWKPASSATLAPHFLMKLLDEAGLPPGVINLVVGSGRDVGAVAMRHPDLAGIHLTGSSETFQTCWRVVGENIASYRTYPRLVGETGGKDFVVAHPSADMHAVHTALIRGAFEYQGQKCSAASRAYIPQSMWPALREQLVASIAEIRMGDVTDYTTFMGAVIDKGAFDNISSFIDMAHAGAAYSVIAGGKVDSSKGWFIEPTLVETSEPRSHLMSTEIFGPVLTVYAYDDSKWNEVLELVDTTSPYALTGAVFAQETAALEQAQIALRNAAGNFYINDKPTGAVVDQQPFGGGRASGTNDKAGSPANLRRWVSPRTIKENLSPPLDWRYAHMGSGLKL